MQRSRHILLAMALLGVRSAGAQEPAPAGAQEPARPPPAPPPHPDLVSGVARPAATPPARALLWIPRAVLFVPRWTFWLVMQPVRLGAWAFERYHIGARFRGSLLAVEAPFGIYPTITVDTMYGITAGARAVHRDLAGRGERLVLRTALSGQYHWMAGATLRSGHRFGRRFTAGLDARYERRPFEAFFGLGNLDELDAPQAIPIDPGAGAVGTRFREHLARVAGNGEVRIAGPLRARLSAALTRRSFASTGGGVDTLSLEEVYDTSRLAGWDGGVDTLYVEGELVFDSRRPSSPYQPSAIDATGWYAAAYLAGATGVAGDPSAYVRHGAEVLRLVDLYRGSRVLALRVLVESIGGSDGRTDGKIAFAELPMLGGSERLRGYPEGRFRDRALVLGTAEYTWDLGNYLAAYLFVDAGRVLPSLADLASSDRLRVGYGGGLQAHLRSSFLGRVQIAASRDGDLQLELVLRPAFGRRERPGRL